MNKLKFTALGALATLGLATAAFAQPKVDHRPQTAETSQTPPSGPMQKDMQGDMSGMKMSDMMAMMNDPEMRTQMKEMMRNCNDMMMKKQERMSQGDAG